MDARAAARDHTRQRIVDAAIELHTRNGILGTSWRDIASAADVSVGTVYNHFRALDDLVPACGEALMARLHPPSPSDVPSVLAGARSLRDRLERAGTHLFGFYERGGEHLHVFPGEAELPAVRAWLDELRDTVDAFVSAALGERQVAPASDAAIRALFDLPTFEALRGRGLDARAAAVAVAHAARSLASSGSEGGRA